MEWVETTGRSIDEAKDAALDRLGVDEEDAEFEILEEPKLGLFGRLRAEARVRARVRPTTPRPKDDRRDRKRRKRPGEDTSSSSSASSPRPAVSPAPESVARQGRPDAGRATTTAVDEPGDRGATGAGDNKTSIGRSGMSRGPSRRRGRGAESAQAGDTTDDQDDDRHPGDAGSAARDGGARMDVPLDEQGAVAQAFLAGLAREMHLQADITVGRPDADTVEVNLDGSDLGLLIGSKGSTLLALQDLTRTVVQRKTGASNGRLLVDVSGYRHKRKEALERFAQQVAEQVKDAGTRKALEPMNAADRKVVHDAINEIDGVMTTSEGEEPNRRVVIFPAPS
jgi:spoIIIJ-associated protein